MRSVLRPAEMALAMELGLQHSQQCRQINADFNSRQPNRWFHRYFCHCDFFERLDHAIVASIREDMRNGVKRILEE